MDTNKMREQFEQWAKDRYSWHLHDDARDPEERTLASWNGETYGNRIVEGMWQAWQASREAVVVEIEHIRSEAKRQEDGLKEMLRRQNKQICALRGKP
ncbi:hypothetical protein [Pseudomonas sp. NFX1]|uniref:hypothetical protein n=1 Tax=Pseudomonas sp. NFX1 TaxID=2201355 RepID=UPI002AD18C9B|nr:hypothetical protein [Pseudomonas putida]